MISTALSSVRGYGRRRLSLTVRIGTMLVTLGVMFLFFGGIVTAGRIKEKPKEAVELKETTYAYMTIQNNYHIKLLVIDYIGTMQEDDVDKEDYYLALFVDGNDKPYYCALRAEQKTAIYNELKEYREDESQVIGDATYDAYFSIRSISKITGLKEKFDEEVGEYDEIISEEFGNVEKGIYYLQYICGADEDYNAVMKNEKTGSVAVGFGAILVSVAMIVGGILLFVREKKKKSLPAEEQTMYQYPQQPGVPNAGASAQQSYAPPQNDPFYQPAAQPQQSYTAPPQGGYEPNAGAYPQQPIDPFYQPPAQPQQPNDPTAGGGTPDGTV